MNAVTPAMAEAPPDPAVRSYYAEDRLVYLRGLMECASRLAEAAMEEALGMRSVDPAAFPGGRDPGSEFLRFARCLRQTAALQARLEAGKFPPLRAAGPEPEPAAVRDLPVNRKKRIRLAVEDSILNEASGERAEDLLTDLRERLDDPAFDGDITDRPIGLVVADICRELGVAFEPRRWTEADMGESPPERAPPDAAPPDIPPLFVRPPEESGSTLAIEPQAPRYHVSRTFQIDLGTLGIDPAPD